MALPNLQGCRTLRPSYFLRFRRRAVSCVSRHHSRRLLPLRPWCVALSLLMVASCRNDASKTGPVASDAVERHIFDDGDPPISAINSYTPLRGDSALVVDNRDHIFLLVSNRRTRIVGTLGEGPCEYLDVTTYSVVGDTVFVLDHRRGKLVGYSVRDGACLSEYVSPDLSRFSATVRAGSWFYFTRTNYTTTLDPQTVLLYRLSLAGELAPLDLQKSDLDADLLMAPIRLGGRLKQIKEKDGGLYFLLPFSHKVWRYDLQDGRVSSFDLIHDSSSIAEHANSLDVNAISSAVGKTEMEMDFFLLDEYIAVASRIRGKWMRSLYSYSGVFMAREEVSGDMMFEEKGVFYEIVPGDDDTRPFVLKPVVPKTGNSESAP